MEPLTLLVAALATARLTRLVTRDQITHTARRAVLRRLDPDGLLAYLVICDWCTSMYMGAAVAAWTAWGPSWALWPLAVLAFSYTAGWLASKEGE
jgi:hypothetical protein